ncbi:peptidase M48 Ste24p [Emticicia oligotrophica DSM 17448]|uniref:Peptidase M48 Ste24p n=1 Tax=Emticicia oligotrophica (strain DSM 17448 / CIP 109782 / MTCC 6937 / GPTSA100-15) TaxID=929562 RepID=A0ABM5N2X6_EMTOG|nr:M48 family metallopeptidase [Emticicia oligotrophica]AFK03785.1 peptidase M48 Ste24p [Emticicia oligotrophica DSM 17448]
MEYVAIYYDGKTSQPYEAQVNFVGDRLIIKYGNGEVEWQIPKIEYSSFTGKGKTMLQYGDFPHQYLEFLLDSPLNKALENYLPKRREGFWAFANELAGAGFRGLLITIAIFVAITVGFYFLLLPKIAEYVAAQIPVETEVELGKQFYDSFVGGKEIDQERTKQLQIFAKKIDFQTKYPLKFTVVKDKQINAFALPGGNVVVFDAILEKIKTPEELAALLSHEVTHVKERHSLKGLSRSLAGSMVVSVIVGDMNSIGNIMVSQANNIYELGFTREMEKEADLEGLEIMFHNKLDPKGMTRLMERLHEEEKKYGVDKMPAYLNSHPMTKERIDYINKESKGHKGEKNKELEEIWRKIEK